jgi:hypothetical protein
MAKVFIQRDAKRGGDVEVMGLADQADGGRAGIQHGGQHIVIGGRLRPTRLVMPKAVMVARVAGAAAKNSLSVGLAPGQPPSM